MAPGFKAHDPNNSIFNKENSQMALQKYYSKPIVSLTSTTTLDQVITGSWFNKKFKFQ